jgi:hypothetical protein
MDTHNDQPTRPAAATPAEPLGDRGAEKTWSPPDGEQGISNRPDDEPDQVPPGEAADDPISFEGADDGDDGEDEEDFDEEDTDDDEDDEDEDEAEAGEKGGDGT